MTEFNGMMALVRKWTDPFSWEYLWTQRETLRTRLKQWQTSQGYAADARRRRQAGEPDVPSGLPQQSDDSPTTIPMDDWDSFAAVDLKAYETAERDAELITQELLDLKGWVRNHYPHLLSLIPVFNASLSRPSDKEIRDYADRMQELESRLIAESVRPAANGPVERLIENLEAFQAKMWTVAGKFIVKDESIQSEIVLPGWDEAYVEAGNDLRFDDLEAEVHAAASAREFGEQVDTELKVLRDAMVKFMNSMSLGIRHRDSMIAANEFTTKLREFRRWAKRLNSPVNPKTPQTEPTPPAIPPKPRKKRGGERKYDPREDEKTYNAWKSGGYDSYADLTPKRGGTPDDIRRALDRHRKRKKGQ